MRSKDVGRRQTDWWKGWIVCVLGLCRHPYSLDTRRVRPKYLNFTWLWWGMNLSFDMTEGSIFLFRKEMLLNYFWLIYSFRGSNIKADYFEVTICHVVCRVEVFVRNHKCVGPIDKIKDEQKHRLNEISDNNYYYVLKRFLMMRKEWEI